MACYTPTPFSTPIKSNVYQINQNIQDKEVGPLIPQLITQYIK